MSNLFKPRYLSPRYWHTWLTFGLLRLVIWLPRRWRYVIGSALGSLLYYLIPSRRHVAEVNVRLCFPDMDDDERRQMVKDVFRQNGTGIIESGMAWWTPTHELAGKIRVVGAEHLQAAHDAGQGVVLMGSHFTVLDMGALLMNSFTELDCFYRPHNNPLFDALVEQGRSRHVERQIAHWDMRTLVRRLRAGKIVWFAPDQDRGPKPSVYAPFFGVSAATVTATARIAKLGNARVIPVAFHRLPDHSYEVELFPALENFPSGDDVADATAVNLAQERAIRKYPTQYMWVHRRFKTHPKG